jgi:hypothetical protein
VIVGSASIYTTRALSSLKTRLGDDTRLFAVDGSPLDGDGVSRVPIDTDLTVDLIDADLGAPGQPVS